MDEIYRKMNPWWQGDVFDTGISRKHYMGLLESSFNRKQVEIITGGRRVGKTTLLKQIILKYAEKFGKENVFFLQVDNNALKGLRLSEHVDNFRKIFGHDRSRKLYVFFDEVQEALEWESEIKSLYDLENLKIFITGSTSYMLSLRGSKLTGRQSTTIVYPLDFNEFMEFKNYKAGPAEGYLYEKYLEEYIQGGGYPENAFKNDPDYMKTLIEDIITRDIIMQFKPRKDKAVFDLFAMVCGSLGSRVSFNKMKNTLGVSLETVRDYINYFNMAYLTRTLEKWSDSVNDRVYSSKKIYLFDTGFKNAFDGRQDTGARSENALFIHLLKKKTKIGYYADGDKETDFILGNRNNPIPVECKMTDGALKNDEGLKGLMHFIKKYKPANAYVVSRKSGSVFMAGNTKVHVLALWEVLTGMAEIETTDLPGPSL